MSTTFPPPQPRGIDFDLPTCGETQCNGHGTCVPPAGGGVDLVCDCTLGYKGEFCDDTVHGDLSLPLTLSVIVVIVGVLILAFIVAKLRQRQKKMRRPPVNIKASDTVVPPQQSANRQARTSANLPTNRVVSTPYLSADLKT